MRDHARSGGRLLSWHGHDARRRAAGIPSGAADAALGPVAVQDGQQILSQVFQTNCMDPVFGLLLLTLVAASLASMLAAGIVMMMMLVMMMVTVAVDGGWWIVDGGWWMVSGGW